MTTVAGPRDGVTVREHVEYLVAGAQALLLGVLRVVRTERRIPKARRDRLRRDLAGVVADCETVRLWLDAGAPEGKLPASPSSSLPPAVAQKEEDVPLPFPEPLPEPPVSWS